MKFKINIKFVLILLLLSLYPVLGRDLSWTVAFGKMNVQIHAWIPDGDSNFSGVLILVPGYNGAGELMLDERWRKVAELNHLVLLAPSFFAEGHENNYGKGYYYPEQGSGLVIEKALDDLHQRTAVHIEKIFFFGFSAGAHFVHRYALWRPDRVKAFVAYSAGWWDGPNQSMKKIPALIMCGENDDRYEATFDFFKKGQKLGCPWIWRSYPNTGHVLTSEVRDMAEAFLADQLAAVEPGKEVKRYGDIQTFKSVPEADKETIPEECRICLPSVKVAEAWEKESTVPHDH